MALALLVLAACAGTPEPPGGIWASGKVAGQPFSARVDSEIARYYLEDFPEPHPDGWHQALAAAKAELPAGVVPSDALSELTRRFGSVDLAALVFMNQVYRLERNRELAACLAAMNRKLQDPGVEPRALFAEDRPQFTILFAPGWLYESNPGTEADFARTRASLDRIGLGYHFVPLAEDGAVEENALMLAEALRKLAGDGQRIIVVSASKSAAEVAYALGHLLAPEESRHVAAWINAGGLVEGSPLADRWTSFPRSLLARVGFLYQGWRYASLVDMRTDRSAARMAKVELPAALVVVNYVAVPMGSQVSAGARRRYQQLARFGPNDGLAPLANTSIRHGITLVEPGADHYFTRVDVGLRTLALTRVVQWHLDRRQCLP